MPSTDVNYQTHDGVARITMTCAPVNTLNRGVRRALLAAIEQAEHDPEVRALVITGSPHFSAGADLAEFDSGEGLAEPTLHLTIAGLLDRMAKPSVAAVDGVALGGGLELALACSARIASPRARLGLPETTLGFMPGAGGTQRLPRAVGVMAALDLIVSGRQIGAQEALEIGLVQQVSDDPVAAASSLALSLSQNGHTRLRDEPIAEPLAEAVAALALRNAQRAKPARQEIIAAVEAVQAGIDQGFDLGLKREFQIFQELAGTDEARAARYRFLNDRSPRAEDIGEPRPIASAAVIGAGTMGRGIALALVAARIPTLLVDTSQEAVDSALQEMTKQLDRAVAGGRLDSEARNARLASIRTSVHVADIAQSDLIIEAVFEDLGVKAELFTVLDSHAKRGAVLASNTSTLDINVLAASTSRPQDVVGMHFFSPANIMRLVEVIEGAETSPSTLATALATVRQLGKLAVIAQVAPGFIGNRIFDAYLRQANLLVCEGISPNQVDQALEQWGMAMGPFRVLDLVGNDVPWRARKGRPEDPAWRFADLVAERGWLGRKTGLGWYDYSANEATPNEDLTAELPTPGTPVGDDEIVSRCILAMVNEAAAVLSDGVAATRSDIDTVLVHGYGFPAKRGGPWFWAELGDLSTATDRMRRWAEETGDPRWLPHSHLLEQAGATA